MRFTYLLPIIIAFSACQNDKKQEAESSDLTKKEVYVPSFNADSAYYFVDKQVSFGPRVPNTKGHVETGDYLIAKLKGYGWEVEEQEFQATTFDKQNLYLRNIIAGYNPKAQKRILLAAHWDTRPWADADDSRQDEPILGANDGASGVGVLIELARVIGQNDSLKVGVDIILFDGEDWGNDASTQDYVPVTGDFESWWCLGSQYWSKNKHRRNYSAYYGILLDMVGGKDAKFYIEGHSNYYAPSIVEKVWGKASQLGYDRYFVRKQGGAITDDHYFVNKIGKIPMIDIIPTDPVDGSFGSFHHTHADNMDIISKETLDAVGVTLLNVIYRE
ncbi:MAG TPA: M28 family peptidase [Fulvivirga sp.]|nr:M28 family peptidase [Fulvivirga sp.]